MPPSPTQALFQQALALHQSGRLDDAERAYRQVMRADPRDYPSRAMLGRLYLDLGRPAEAEKAAEAAVRLDPRGAPGLSTLALALLRTRKFRQAVPVLERACAADPSDWSLRHNLGDALAGLDRPAEALAAYDRTLAMEPRSAETWAARAGARLDLGQPDAALADARQALALSPRSAQALAVAAEALTALGREAEAVEAYGAASVAAPDNPALSLARARLLLKAGRDAEAAQDASAALTRSPKDLDALVLRSQALARLHRFDAALADCDAALALSPKDAELHFTRGLRLEALGRLADAVAAYDRAGALSGRSGPVRLNALNNRAVAQIELQRYAEAIPALRQVLADAPRHRYAFGALAHALRLTCDWADAPAVEAELAAIVADDLAEVPPGTVLIYSGDPALQQAAARGYARRNLPALAARPAPASRGPDERLRIAYVSADFRSHAVARLAVEAFERHDRARFDVTAISIGPDDKSPLRARVVEAFETFVEAAGRSDDEIAALMRQRGIDIAVDLGGYTIGARPGVFARRPAPIQVNYLGFPGTLGSEVWDYLIADPVVAPDALDAHVDERLVRLPWSYQPNDSRRGVPETRLTRAEAGLPDDGFVFCSFNNSFKITPQVFDVWMRLLAATPGSVLWILADHAITVANLRREAQARGVDPARLVVAPRVPLEDHLARHRLADLFLDTTPCSAHTTASDALWMGLPLVTVLGEAFAGRVGASLCRAAGLDELVVPDLGAYEALALSLAREPARLAAIRARLETDRLDLPLFDAQAYARAIEAAYETMWARRTAAATG